MQTIAQNNYYELKYDENKNRVYFKIFGFWQSMSEVPNYHSDMEKPLKKPNLALRWFRMSGK